MQVNCTIIGFTTIAQANQATIEAIIARISSKSISGDDTNDQLEII